MVIYKIALITLAIFALVGDYGFLPVLSQGVEKVDEVELEILNKQYLQEQVNIQFDILKEDYFFNKFVDIKVCSTSSSKTYMSHTLISRNSIQGKFIDANMTIKDGFLYDKDGFIGVALGSSFGNIGDRFIFTLDSGVELKLIKIERKADKHTFNGCEQRWDKSVIEFVIDPATNLIPRASNGYIAQGNFNNLEQFRGRITRVRKELR
jgi:hypothetical protein